MPVARMIDRSRFTGNVRQEERLVESAESAIRFALRGKASKGLILTPFETTLPSGSRLCYGASVTSDSAAPIYASDVLRLATTFLTMLIEDKSLGASPETIRQARAAIRRIELLSKKIQKFPPRKDEWGRGLDIPAAELQEALHKN